MSERTGRECTRFVCHDSKLNILCPSVQLDITQSLRADYLNKVKLLFNKTAL